MTVVTANQDAALPLSPASAGPLGPSRSLWSHFRRVRTAMKREAGAAHLCSHSVPGYQRHDGNHAPKLSSHSSCRRRQRRRHDKALHAR